MIAASPSESAGTAVDYRRLFIPEEITPLFFMPIHSELTREQRLRFNQLYTSSFHEQFMNLEKVLVNHLLPPLITRFGDEPLAESLRIFRNEENMHTRMFHELHVRCEPHLYSDCEFYFIHMPRWMKAILHFVSSRPALFPFCLWLTIVEEERTIYYSKQILKQAEELEPHVVDIHRRHLADEVGHVRWDEELLNQLWPRRRSSFRNINARLFAHVLCEYFNMPKRAGARVIQQWIKECAELSSLAETIRQQFMSLEHDHDYLLTLYTREMVPKSFALLDRWREFAFLSRMLPGYIAVSY